MEKKEKKAKIGHVITFINEKGGVGKTSLCFNAAWEMSKGRDRILLVDMDGQKSNLTYFCGVELAPKQDTVYEVLQGYSDIESATVNIKKNMDIVPADSRTSYISPEFKASVLRKNLAKAREEYDYIFLDVSPSPNASHSLSLSCSDSIVIPMLPDITSINAYSGIIESVTEIWEERMNVDLKVLGLVFMKYNSKTNLSKIVREAAEEMAKKMDSRLFKTTIRQAVSMSENVSQHVGITDYDPSAKVSAEIKDFVQELKKEVKRRG